jgi:hypothetical protein
MPKTSPDTHNPAAQASAAKFIKILREAYPYIALLTIDDGIATSAQASLLQYLDSVIHPASLMSEEEKALARENSSIRYSIQWIDYVRHLPSETLSEEDKKSIFEQMKVIASSYPGGVWDAHQEQWSINQFYNKDTETADRMMTPPAAALNLVCRALFDKTRYLSEDDQWENDFGLRAITVYLHLLHLRQQTREGQLEKCAAGLQHDLLYCLNGSYLDKPRAEHGKPVELLMDTGLFLQSSLSTFVAAHISERSTDAATSAMVLNWMHWASMDGSDDRDNPMILWLRGLFASEAATDPDVGWKHACTAYVTTRCKEYGLNPGGCSIADFIDMLKDIPVVVSHHVVLPLVSEIMQMGELAIPPTSGPHSIGALIGLRNRALAQFKAQFQVQPQEAIIQQHPESIRDLFSSLACVDSLYRYRDLSVLVGAEDAIFQSAQTGLKALLLDYFTGYSLDKRIPIGPFESTRSAYLRAERGFLAQNNVTFIENFFALMDGEQGTWDGIWARLEALRFDITRQHPLVLSDEALLEWRRQSTSLSAALVTMVDVTPYAINRFLLHGLLLPIREWSPLYCEYLSLVTDWLLRPSEPGEELLRQLKETQTPCLLANLRFLLMLKGLGLDEQVSRSLLQFSPLPWHLSYKINVFTHCFELSLEQLNESQRGLIWTEVEGRLGELIRSGYDLHSLLNLSPEQLNESQKMQIWRAVSGQLGELICFGRELCFLQALSLEQLNEEQRTQIWTALSGRLGEIIHYGKELGFLLDLTVDRICYEQKRRLWTEMAGCLGEVILSGYDLRSLLRLSLDKLNEEQRAQIWDSVANRLGEVISTGYDLHSLLELPPEQLNNEKKNQIWSAVVGQLGGMIRSFKELNYLLFLSKDKLNETQRTQILTALTGKLSQLISSSHDLHLLFRLPLRQLNEAQRTQILTALAGGLVEMIRSTDDLLYVFSLLPKKLNIAQRAQIWEAVAGQLGETMVFRYSFQLQNLISLSLEQFNEAQRTRILSIAGDRIGEMMFSGYDLSSLLCLSREQLNEAQRAQIWASVSGRLVKIIKSGSQLHSLLSLSPEQLNEAQRAQIWTSVSGHLGKIIRSGSDLESLMSLSPEQLNEEQKGCLQIEIFPTLPSGGKVTFLACMEAEKRATSAEYSASIGASSQTLFVLSSKTPSDEAFGGGGRVLSKHFCP